MVTLSRPVGSTNTGQAVLTTPAVSNAWQLGTILKAMVLSAGADGNAQLQIGARVVTAQTSLELQTGQTLRLQVAETGRTVILKSVDVANNDPVRAAVRQNLPRQLPQSTLLATAISLSRNNSQYPAELRDGATRLVNAMRESATLTQGKGLRLAVRDSGTFLEARLAAGLKAPNRPVTRVAGDWKAALLQFREVLTQQQQRLAGDAIGRQFQQPGSALSAQNPGRSAGAVAQTGLSGYTGASGTGSSGIATSGTAAGGAAAGVKGNIPAGVFTTQSSIAGALPGTGPGSFGALPSARSLMPGIVATAGAPTGSQDAAMQSPVTSHQGRAVANESSPPMRHAMPQAQPVVQAGGLLADPLNLIGELINDNNGALARVRLNQLASVTTEQGNRQVWLLELPVRHPDNRAEVVTLRIEQDQEGNDTQEKSDWTADLAFDLGTKGQLRARVALRAGRVSVLFWADADQTRTEVQGELPRLKTAMEKKQLDVANLSAGVGHPETKPASPASLLETRA